MARLNSPQVRLRTGRASTILALPEDIERSPDDPLSPAEVAKLYGRKVKTLANWRWRGVGPIYHRSGNRIVYKRGDADAWFARRRVVPRT